jgi:signal transduction histidine kinase
MERESTKEDDGVADSPQRSTSLESTVADIVVSATELMSGQVRPAEAVIERVMETLAAGGGVQSVRRVRVQRGQYDDSIGRYRAGNPILHRIRIPASGEAIEVEIAGREDPRWAGTEQVWRLHSALMMITAALTAPPSTDPVEQLLWHARSVVVQLERDRWSIRSSAGTRVLGYSPDITRHQEPLSLVDPRDRFEAMRAYVQTISGRQQTTTIDLRVLAADGSYRVLEATFVNMPSGGGRRTVAVYGVDMTAQRADAARLREFVLRLGGGVLVVDETGRVRLANEAFTRMFGTVAGGWSGKHQREALRAVVAACHDEASTRQRLALVGQSRKQQVERLDLADGRVLDLDRTPLFEQGLDLGALWQFRDVSADPAPRLSTAAEDRVLDAAVEKQNRVLATVSHELRTPLTAVVSFAELLMETAHDGLTDEQRAATEVIGRNTRRLLTLVDDLLLLSRLESTRVSLRHGAVDVPALIATAITDRKLAAAELEIDLTGETAEGPALTGDAGRLNQVLANLIHNAMKFSPRGSSVRVTASYDSPEWTITITDNGMGIPATELDRLTRGFERGSNAVAAGIAGSGLGLAICRELVELHHGRMSITSTLNVGTEVRIMLPAGEGER